MDTTSGKVQGIANTGIKEFKGIPYGAPTGGKNRYMPPKKPAAWTGVRECFGHGQICPQTLASLNSDYAMLIQWDLHVGGMGDCLSLNIWTPGVNDGAVHGTDVSASFYNYRDGVGGTGSPQEKALWQRFAAAWVSLAKTADPNNPKVPHWAPYDATQRATMIFDNEIRLENDPRGDIRKFWADMPAPDARRS